MAPAPAGGARASASSAAAISRSRLTAASSAPHRDATTSRARPRAARGAPLGGAASRVGGEAIGPQALPDVPRRDPGVALARGEAPQQLDATPQRIQPRLPAPAGQALEAGALVRRQLAATPALALGG